MCRADRYTSLSWRICKCLVWRLRTANIYTISISRLRVSKSIHLSTIGLADSCNIITKSSSQAIWIRTFLNTFSDWIVCIIGTGTKWDTKFCRWIGIQIWGGGTCSNAPICCVVSPLSSTIKRVFDTFLRRHFPPISFNTNFDAYSRSILSVIIYT
jgi:hypothetical protein